MRFFFKSKKFKILLAVFSGVLALTMLLYVVGESAAPGSSILGTVTAPFRNAANWISREVKNFFDTFNNYDKLAAENEALKKENETLVSELVGFQEALQENEFLKEFLEIKEKNKDYIMEPATVVARDTSDPYGGFTINKGSIDGIAKNDPVITSSGLVGYVTEVGLSYSKVTTIMSNDINVAAVDRRTADIGVVAGTIDLAKNGKCRMYNIQRDAIVASGDYIVTAGGGIFPSGLIIGKVTAVKTEDVTVSLYAEIEPTVDILSVQNVMVLTYFAGQGDFAPKGE